MSRFALGAVATAVLVVIAASAWLGLFGRTNGIGGPTPSAGSSAIAVLGNPSQSGAVASPAPSDLAVGAPFPVVANVIAASQTYHTVGFSQPLALTMGSYAANPSGEFNAETKSPHLIRIWWGGGDYAVTIADDVRLSADLCTPTTAVLDDIPRTPVAVGSWLHGIAGLTTTNLPDISVAGTYTKAWDVALGAACKPAATPPPGDPEFWFGPGEQHRIYAVPTGVDTILVVTWPGPGLESKINPETEKLVTSLRFR